LAEQRGVTFTESDNVVTDGTTFIECSFERANLLYSGGEHPRFERCRFSNASWEFGGAALRTTNLLRAINGSPGGDAFIADLLAPLPPAPQPPVRAF
jgi:hypothetical protein